MQDVIPNLWPEDLSNDQVLTPLVIMRHQAGQLRNNTKGLVEAEVKSTSEAQNEIYEFELVAPALNRYRYRLFTARHREMRVYPVTVDVEDWENPLECSTQGEFFEALKRIFGSRETKSLIMSIIAQSNERQGDTSAPGGQRT